MLRTLTSRISVAVVAVIVIGAALLVWSRYEYKQWAWQSYPDPLSWCGRHWVPAEARSLDQIRATEVDFRRAGDLPGLLNSGAVWTSRAKGASDLGTRCPFTSVWVQLGDDRFELMSLSGGP